MPSLTREPVVPARLRRDDGFTLAESVVSVALFVIVAAAATFAIVSAIRANEATALRVAATQLAEQRLDQLRAAGVDALPPESEVIADGRAFEVQVTATPGAAESCADAYRDVAVQVRSGVVSVRLDTRLACERSLP